MQIRKLNGGRLAGVKAVLKATPEKIWYRDRSGIIHTSVVHILSLEVGGPDLRSLLASMEEPAKLFQQGRSVGSNGGTQYVIREAEAERAPEIAGEFYPNGDAACSELAEASTAPKDEDETIARICELTKQLGYNQAKTKMLLGQCAGNLAGLERKLLNELSEGPESAAARGCEATNRRPAPNEPQHDISGEANPEKFPTPVVSNEGSLSEGFLF
jgi:hypothetical protein